MRTIERLRREALEGCSWRGHHMRPFARLGKTSRNAICQTCHMEVVIDSKPAPNGIDIGGEAIALNCCNA